MLYNWFEKQIKETGLTRLWVNVSISDAATIVPLGNSPVLGKPGDFTKDCTYKVIAADGSSREYVLKTVKGF